MGKAQRVKESGIPEYGWRYLKVIRPDGTEDVKEVPIPLDPVTGKPFEYKQEGDHATLFAPAPPGEKPNAGNSVKYEITLVK